jgi:uncharacterized protein (TIGR02118 family)
MIKELSLFPRRSDLTTDHFRHHYEAQHVPLALRYNRVFIKYARNHVVGLRLDNPVFDTLTEIWYGSQSEAEGAWAAYANYHEIVEDERRFMDRSNIISLQTEETLISGTTRAAESGVVVKAIFLLRRGSRVTPSDFRFAAAEVAARLGTHPGCFRTMLDTTCSSLAVPGASPYFQGRPDGFVSLWLEHPVTSPWDMPAVHGVELIGTVNVDQIESPAELLRD